MVASLHASRWAQLAVCLAIGAVIFAVLWAFGQEEWGAIGFVAVAFIWPASWRDDLRLPWRRKF